ncbi:hypothetical protein JRO89_XS01G0363300 [Xanthoceras sorbifolium]|uniref:Uncharacterized protein n=1 Tax=Xanthoceras sorbifolium TaxID=99658 RepID=A0ABQ8INK9_9ROSI|nr:hypothetical protein JRO89_XS01G0363300 [Xanthoceras sorbifolium]
MNRKKKKMDQEKLHRGTIGMHNGQQKTSRSPKAIDSSHCLKLQNPVSPFDDTLSQRTSKINLNCKSLINNSSDNHYKSKSEKLFILLYGVIRSLLGNHRIKEQLREMIVELKMATDKGKAEVSETQNDSIQNNSTDQPPSRKEPRKPNFGKALAHRALCSPGTRRAGSRKDRTNDVRTLPSRLSKVSLADYTDDDEEKE